MELKRAPRFSVESRPSDFVARRAGHLFSAGCCCCCCCLHWVGAAVGAGMGIHSGFKTAQQTRPVHPALKSMVIWGLAAGVALTAGVAAVTELWIALAFAPSLLLLPPIVTMLVLVAGKGVELRRRFLTARKTLMLGDGKDRPDEGVFRTAAMVVAPKTVAPRLSGLEICCPRCWTALPDAEVTADCPHCSAPLDRPVFPAMSSGYRLALSVGGRAFLYSSGLTIAGYVVMYLALIVFK
ncbi:MAG: hypothetical protein KF819_12515 [Labilithrix sp.]|nr:hypothetical protein [Labilithrix sp.]